MRQLALIVLLIALSGCRAIYESVVAPPEPVGILTPEILSERPHDANAFTQGFLIEDGRLFESTGLTGRSSLREVDLATGEVLRSVPVPEQYFAEGLALVDDRLIQLTWQHGVAFIYDVETFEQIGTYTYTGEGWGLCYDGTELYMSDGSSNLFVRDAQTFELLDQISVTVENNPVVNLNELECVGEVVYANVWQTDAILEIDKTTGDVRNIIDGSTLLTPEQRASLTDSNAVLNGIAYDPSTGNFFITGKLYPVMWEVQFSPQPER